MTMIYCGAQVPLVVIFRSSSTAMEAPSVPPTSATSFNVAAMIDDLRARISVAVANVEIRLEQVWNKATNSMVEWMQVLRRMYDCISKLSNVVEQRAELQDKP